MPTFTHIPTRLILLVPPKNGYSLLDQTLDKQGNPLFELSWHGYTPYTGKADAMLVRDPVERIISAYRNKILYRTFDEFSTHWVCKITGIPIRQAETIRLEHILQAIERLLKNGRTYKGWEFHFYPQQWQGDTDNIPRFYDIRHDHDLLRHLGVDPEQRPNRTDNLPFETTDDEREWIRDLYKMDLELYERYLDYRRQRLTKGIIL